MFRAATACLCLAFASGLGLAGVRFFTDRASPPWLAKLHGFAAVGALALLGLAWATAPLTSAAVFAVLALLLAAAGGVALNLGYHWRQRALPEGLVFAHMSVAFVGFLVVVMVLLSGTP